MDPSSTGTVARPGGASAPAAAPFRTWDATSWVRTKPRQDLRFDAALEFFSPEHVPLLNAPVARERLGAAARREAGALHLLWQLHATVVSEITLVNTACVALADPGFLPWLSRDTRRDVLRVYTDEGGHAEMAATMSGAVLDATGVAPVGTTPEFLAAVRRTAVAAGPELTPYVWFFATVVYELLVSTTLSDVPRDPRVQPGVRELFADHAADEHRHATFFRDLFAVSWPRLPADARELGREVLPALLRSFVAPDRAALAATAARYAAALGEVEPVVEAAARGIVASGVGARVTAPARRVFAAHGLPVD